MARPRREQPAPHLVFVDTSTLFFQDKSKVVDPKFDELLRTYSAEFQLKLKLPAVVRGELLFQQTKLALSRLNDANKNIEAVSEITGKRYSHRVRDERVRKEVGQRFDAWVASVKGELVSTPTQDIDWNNVIENAVWRKPPFSTDDNKEKGFRDAMILETVALSIKDTSTDEAIAFLCKDKLLRGAADERLRSDGRFSSFETIDDFRSYLDLTREELEDKFIKALIRRASEKFFVKDDRSTLAYSENIAARLKEKHPEAFSVPDPESKGLGLFALSPPEKDQWESLDRGMFWVKSAQFLDRSESGWYSWKSPVIFVQEYRRIPEKEPSLLAAFDPSRVLIAEFSCVWRARVTTDGRFRSIEYLEDSVDETSFKIPSEEDRANFNLSATTS